MPLKHVGFVPLPPGAEPGFDHADVYLPTGRLYVAHTGADRIDMIDCATSDYLGALNGHPGVAGILVDQEQDLLFTSDRACARVSIFRLPDEELLGQVAVGPHPNGLAYDWDTRRLYSFNLGELLGENCTASVVDVLTLEVRDEVRLPGRPRWAVYDADRRVIYVNIREPAVVVVIDSDRAEITDAFDVPSAGPHGLWLDGRRLYCAADGGELIVLDCVNGTVGQSLPLPGVPDVVWLDSELRRLYVAIGEPGVVCSFDTKDTIEPLGITPTEPGAHTLTVNPLAHRVYVFCPESGGAAVYAPS